jgi:hypothetical protein
MDNHDMKAKLLQDLIETMMGLNSEEEKDEGEMPMMGEKKEPMSAKMTIMAMGKDGEGEEEEGEEEDPLMKMKKAKMMGA